MNINKRITNALKMLLVSLILGLFTVSAVSAATLYYTFTGEITDTSLDNALIIHESGLKVGDPVQYIVEINFDRQGETIYNDGSIWLRDDSTGVCFDPSCPDGACFFDVDSFYAHLVSGSLIEEKDGGIFNDPDDWLEVNRGDQRDVSPCPDTPDPYNGTWGYLTLDSRDQLTTIRHETMATRDWVVGTTVSGNENAYGVYIDPSISPVSVIESSLELTAISDTIPIINVDIDIQPNKTINKVRLDRIVKVAILSTYEFDARNVDDGTVKFAGAAPTSLPRYKDVNRDGYKDSVFSFIVPNTNIQCGDTEAALTGTWEGQPIIGTDSIVTVRCD